MSDRTGYYHILKGKNIYIVTYLYLTDTGQAMLFSFVGYNNNNKLLYFIPLRHDSYDGFENSTHTRARSRLQIMLTTLIA